MSDTDTLLQDLDTALRVLGRLPTSTLLDAGDLTLTLSPREADLKSKEIPVETFLKKVVSVRDKLRVLEQRVNASAAPLAEKVALHQHITTAYASVCTLTAFFTDDALLAEESGSEELA